MPRLTEQRREARRAEIVAAARRCFARDGFHATSMPAIAAEAGLSAGAFYRHFAGKDDVVVAVAAQAFATLFEPVERLLAEDAAPGAAELVAASIGPTTAVETDDGVPVAELLRCGVEAWAELLHHDDVRVRAQAGFDRARGHVAEVLRRGRTAGTVRGDLDADDGARVLVALLHGFVVQRVALGLDDVDGFLTAVRVLLRPA